MGVVPAVKLASSLLQEAAFPRQGLVFVARESSLPRWTTWRGVILTRAGQRLSVFKLRSRWRVRWLREGEVVRVRERVLYRCSVGFCVFRMDLILDWSQVCLWGLFVWSRNFEFLRKLKSSQTLTRMIYIQKWHIPTVAHTMLQINVLGGYAYLRTHFSRFLCV